MAERRCELAMRQCRHALNACHITNTYRPTRAFSSTTSQQRQGTLPTFHPTSSSELDTLLTNVRNTIFLPNSLRVAQRKLIFRTRHHAMLRAEPLQITLNDETHTLQPLDATKDIPDSWKSLQRAMELMGRSRADWLNLPGLLAGMYMAGRRWHAYQWNRIIRKAGEMGMASSIVETARRARHTGLQLRDVSTVRAVMHACRERALLSNWERGETAKALACAENVATLLEEKEHCASNRVTGPDPRTQQDVIAVIVELAGMRAKKYQEGKDLDGKLKSYTQRLMPNVRRVTQEGVQEGQDNRESARMDIRLTRWIPVREALRLAVDVLGDECPRKEVAMKMITDLEGITIEAGNAIRSQMEKDGVEEKRRGLVWLEEADARL